MQPPTNHFGYLFAMPFYSRLDLMSVLWRSITSSVEMQLAAVDGRGLNFGGPVNPSVMVDGAASCGSLPDLLGANITAPLISPLDVGDSVTSVTASLPSYDMAVASTRRAQQASHLSQNPVVMTDSCAKTSLLSGGNTVMIVPQVALHSSCTIIASSADRVFVALGSLA